MVTTGSALLAATVGAAASGTAGELGGRGASTVGGAIGAGVVPRSAASATGCGAGVDAPTDAVDEGGRAVGSASAWTGFERSLAASNGQPMRADVRRKLEPAFGADFSRVRIHEGAQAQMTN